MIQAKIAQSIRESKTKIIQEDLLVKKLIIKTIEKMRINKK